VVRRAALDNASNSAGAPRNLTRGRGTTNQFTVDVWKARTLVQLQGGAENPSNVARMMIDQGYSSDNHNTLRVKVARGLDRIASCERFKPHGKNSPIWPATSLVSLRNI